MIQELGSKKEMHKFFQPSYILLDAFRSEFKIQNKSKRNKNNISSNNHQTVTQQELLLTLLSLLLIIHTITKGWRTHTIQHKNTTWTNEYIEKQRSTTYFGGVEPDQIERIEIKRRVRTVKNRPSSELSRCEAWDDNAGEFGIVSGERTAVFGGRRSRSGDDEED